MSTNFRTAWRSITRNPRYAALHIIGLGMAIACGLFIYQYITFHLSFDKYHRKAERTYKLVSDILLEKPAHNEGASYAIYQALKTKVTGVERAAFAMANQQLTFRVNGHLFESDGKAAFASPDWFDLFDFQWLAGQPEALGEPHTIVLRASTAVRFFGSEDPMGEIIEVADVPLTVAGILADEPANTSLKSTCYISEASIPSILRDIDDGFFSYWGYLNSSNQVYVCIAPGTSIAQVEKTLQDMTMEAFGEDAGKLFKFSLLPLGDIHFDEQYGGTMRKSLLAILAAVGAAILLMALLNYVNLSIAQYARRSAEFGTRKVLGGSRWQLFAQSMAESLTVAAWATCFGLCVAAAAIPLANNHLFATEPIPQFSVKQFIAVALVSWLTIGAAAGIYPAWVIGNLRALRAMRQQLGLGHPMGRKFMVVVQHALSFCLIVATIVIMRQVHYLQHTDIGFDRESVLMLPLPKGHANDGHWRTFLDTQPAVASYSYCFRSPANHDQRGSTLRFDNRPEWETWPAKTTFADSSYLQTFGIRLLAGRNIRTAATTREYMINELMAQQLGAGSPDDVLGKPLLFGGIEDEPGIIVGVVDNYNIHALSEAIEPTVLGYSEPFMQSLAIKIVARDMRPLIDKLEQEWKARYPDIPFHFQFVDDQIEQLYVAESTQQQLIWIASGLAILISCLGLFGLIALSVHRRTKEIGIRKVLGASVAGIATMLSIDLLKLIAVAIALASPLAWWAMNKWLEDFAYRIDIQWWMFAIAGLAAVVIALLTVSWQAIRAALANPVDSLRDE